VLLKLTIFRQNSKFKNRGPGLPKIKVGVLGPNGHPVPLSMRCSGVEVAWLAQNIRHSSTSVRLRLVAFRCP